MQGSWMSVNNGTFPQCQVDFGRGEWADPAVPTSQGQKEVMGTPRPLQNGYDESVLLHGLGGHMLIALMDQPLVRSVRF